MLLMVNLGINVGVIIMGNACGLLYAMSCLFLGFIFSLFEFATKRTWLINPGATATLALGLMYLCDYLNNKYLIVIITYLSMFLIIFSLINLLTMIVKWYIKRR